MASEICMVKQYPLYRKSETKEKFCGFYGRRSCKRRNQRAFRDKKYKSEAGSPASDEKKLGIKRRKEESEKKDQKLKEAGKRLEKGLGVKRNLRGVAF